MLETFHSSDTVLWIVLFFWLRRYYDFQIFSPLKIENSKPDRAGTLSRPVMLLLCLLWEKYSLYLVLELILFTSLTPMFHIVTIVSLRSKSSKWGLQIPFFSACPLKFWDLLPFMLKIIGNSNLWLGIPHEIRSSFFSSSTAGSSIHLSFLLQQIFFCVLQSYFIVGFIYLYFSTQVDVSKFLLQNRIWVLT